MNTDMSKMTYRQMVDLIKAVGVEVKRRNPIGVNLYIDRIREAWYAVDEIATGEASNFTSECGPREPKPRGKRK